MAILLSGEALALWALIFFLLGLGLGYFLMRIQHKREEETEIKLMYLSSIDGEQAKRLLEQMHKRKMM